MMTHLAAVIHMMAHLAAVTHLAAVIRPDLAAVTHLAAVAHMMVLCQEQRDAAPFALGSWYCVGSSVPFARAQAVTHAEAFRGGVGVTN